ncbi:MAG TPA: RtcB family protein [Saprospiraceae bacterium]|nr:RtcB family protein [Saprospiraceae bacterium]
MRNIKIFGEPIIDEGAIGQLKNCVGEEDYGVLTADAHIGYGHPIGGAIAYRNKISLSGVGFDIACGNKAVRTDIRVEDLDMAKLMDEIEKVISFGMGRKNNEKVDHPVIDTIQKLKLVAPSSVQTKIKQRAAEQLGTVGSGNHFVDIFKDEQDFVWIGVHFGSRGFGHMITTGFIAVSHGKEFGDKVNEGGMFSDPILFDVNSETGQDYLHCLDIAGQYAYAGRDWVVNKVIEILGNPRITFEVHNHHNFAWKEKHFGEECWVVRKGCTPAFPGQKGFIGSNMFDASVIVEGKEGVESKAGLYSTVHGAGRVMSRRKALGKVKIRKDSRGRKIFEQVEPGLVNYKLVKENAHRLGIQLRGGGPDESPQCYKNLDDVLKYQGDTIKVLYRLYPVGVAMAGQDVFDPYKD